MDYNININRLIKIHMTIEKIRKTCKPPLGNRKDIAKFLPMRHSQMSELTSQSIISVGIDIRQPHSNWGEKTTNTHLYFYIIEGKLQFDSKGIYAEAGQLITYHRVWINFLLQENKR